MRTMHATKHVTKRAVIVRSLLAFVFLLIAVSPYVTVVFDIQNGAFFSVFVTPLFLVCSEIAAISAITAGSHVTDRRKRQMLVWSLLFIFSGLAALVMLLGSYLIASTPICTDPQTAGGCMQNIGIPAYVCMGAFAFLSVLAVLVAPILAFTHAASAGKWLWFLFILVYLLGSLAALGSLFIPLQTPIGANIVASFTSREWLSILRAVSPLLLPLFTLIYSLTGRERTKDKALDKATSQF